jgi:DNA-binding NarL/FixJ family response regulator
MTSSPETIGRLLVADDDDAVRRFTSAVLRSAGFQVDLVETGFAAAEALTRNSYDACIADIKMPGNEQLELVQRLRSGPLVPLVLMTGQPSVETAVTAIRGGVLDYILKPFTPEDLLASVGEVVRRGRELRATAKAQSALIEAATQVVASAAGTDYSFERYRHAGPVRAATSTDGAPQLPAELVDSLSPRQQEVVQLLALGHPVPEVAEMLDLSVHTVRGHMKGIFSKVGVQSQVALLSRLAGHASPKAKR